MDITSIQNFISTTLAELAIKVAAAIAFWVIGRWLIAKVIGLYVRAGGVALGAYRSDGVIVSTA